MTAITLPTLPTIREARPRLVQFNTRLVPTLGGPEQRIQRMGSRFAVDFGIAALSPGPARSLLAAIMKAQSLGSTVVTSFPQPAFTDSIGTPLVNGASQTGSALAIDGLTAPVQLLTYSEDFSNAAWTKGGASVAATTGTLGPDRVSAAEKIQEDTSTGGHYVIQTATTTANTQYVASIYLKAAERIEAFVSLYDGAGGQAFVTVNLQTGSMGVSGTVGPMNTTSFSVTAAGNGFWRVAISAKTTQTQIQLQAAGSVSASSSYQGATGAGFYAWGAQLQLGSSPTAYKRSTTAQVAIPAGFFFSVSVSSRNYLYLVTDDATVNSSGQSTLAIAPMLRASPADNAAVNFSTPQIEGFLPDEASQWTIDMLMSADFNLAIAEAA